MTLAAQIATRVGRLQSGRVMSVISGNAISYDGARNVGEMSLRRRT